MPYSIEFPGVQSKEANVCVFTGENLAPEQTTLSRGNEGMMVFPSSRVP